MGKHGKNVFPFSSQFLYFCNVPEKFNTSDEILILIERGRDRSNYRNKFTVFLPDIYLDGRRLLFFLKGVKKQRACLPVRRAMKNIEMRFTNHFTLRYPVITSASGLKSIIIPYTSTRVNPIGKLFLTIS